MLANASEEVQETRWKVGWKFWVEDLDLQVGIWWGSVGLEKVGRNRAVVAQNVLVKHIKECHDYEATRCRIKDCLGVTLWDTHKKLTVHETSHSFPPRKCSRANCNSRITLRTSPLSWSVQWESIRLLERMQMPWCQISLPPERSTLGMFKGISFIPQSTWGLSVELQELIRR